MPDDASSDPAAALLQHLDRLFVWARLVSPDEETAADLVRATYQRAAVPGTPPPDDDELPGWLFAQMMALRAEITDAPPPGSSEGETPSPLRAVRAELATDLLHDRLRTAFALQSARDQLLLVLSMDDAVATTAIARGFDYSDDELSAALVAARDRLWTEVQRGTTEAEMRLLRNHLPEDALKDALNRLLSDAWATPPPGLRPAAAALAQRSERLGEAEAPAGAPAGAPPAQPPQRNRSAAERSSSRSGRFWTRLRRFGSAMLLIAVAGMAAYLLSVSMDSSSGESPSSAADLIELAAQNARTIQPMVTTQRPDEAARVVQNELGRRLTVPTVEAAQLQGVSIVELTEGARVPAFLFSDSASGERLTVYALSYALLDENTDRLALSRTVRQAIEDDRRVDVHQLDEAGVLVWRNRNDIYLAVTRADAEALRSRIAPSS